MGGILIVFLFPIPFYITSCFLSHLSAQDVSIDNGDEVPNESFSGDTAPSPYYADEQQTGQQSPADKMSTKRFYGKLNVTESKTPCKPSHIKGKKNRKKSAPENEIDSPIAQTVELKGERKTCLIVK